MKKLKIADPLAPQKITPEDHERLRRETRIWRDAMWKGTASMRDIGPTDWTILIK